MRVLSPNLRGVAELWMGRTDSADAGPTPLTSADACVWERLERNMALVILGNADPQVVKKINRILNHKWKAEDFPPELRAEATRMLATYPNFADDLFLKEPGADWLPPEWFDGAHRNDPTHPAYLFRATPEQYWPRFCELLDPEGKFNLAEHLLPNPIEARRRAEAREAAS